MPEHTGKLGQTVFEDGLQAGGFIPIPIRNIEVGSDTVVYRGDLMAAATPAGVYSLATASDTGKYFVIARDNFTASSDSTITQAYTSGEFHAEKIRTSATDTSVLDALELELRRQNIHLTHIKEIFWQAGI